MSAVRENITPVESRFDYTILGGDIVTISDLIVVTKQIKSKQVDEQNIH